MKNIKPMRRALTPCSTTALQSAILSSCLVIYPLCAQEISLESAPPVVVNTTPAAGASEVDPALNELRVTFSKPMADGSWSWSTWGEDTFPDTTGKPHYEADGKTCVLPVKLEPGKFYASWLNSDKFHNFKDPSGRSAVPYLLTFRTAGSAANALPVTAAAGISTSVLNDNQKLVVAWTDRQFRGFLDRRTFDGWSEQQRADLENSLLQVLDGPQTREYYQAINSLGALRSAKAVQPLLTIAIDRREKDCRDRWMATRALGMIGDKSVAPSLIHLVYHGNVNTRWWAQIALVQLTSVNFGKDWQAWGNWWTAQGGQPAFNPEFVRWYTDPELGDLSRVEQTLAARDQQFLDSIRPKNP
jgi:hypothetical protein